MDLIHRQAPATITRTATHPTTMPMTMAAHTTTPAPAERDQPPTQLLPQQEDRLKAAPQRSDQTFCCRRPRI